MPDDNDIAVESTARKLLGQTFLPDEKILWAGQPDPSVIFSKEDIGLIPFTLIMGSCLIYEGTMGIILSTFGKAGQLTPLDIVWALFCTLVTLTCLYIIFGRFFYKRWNKKRTYYVVTDKRVAALTGPLGKDMRAVRIDALPMLKKDIRADGIGTIIFAYYSDMDRAFRYTNSGMDFIRRTKSMIRRCGEPPMAFYDIKNADCVYELVDKLMNEKRRA